MPDPMLGQRRSVAARDAVPPDPADLEMRGGDGENVAVPLACRESLPGVRRVFRRMRPAIHIDGSLGSLPGAVRVPRDDLLRGRIHFLPDPHIERSARRVVGRMRLALMLGQREDFGVPAVPAHASRVGDRKPQIVADFGARECVPADPHGTRGSTRRINRSAQTPELPPVPTVRTARISLLLHFTRKIRRLVRCCPSHCKRPPADTGTADACGPSCRRAPATPRFDPELCPAPPNG